MNLSHKIQLVPTDEQRIGLHKAFGVARFTYNWAITKYLEIYHETGKRTSPFQLKKIWNEEKKESYPWVYESPKDANQQPFTNFKKGLDNYFNKKIKRGTPKYKKRGSHDSFYLSNDKAKIVDGSYLHIPKIGKIKLTEPLRFQGKINNFVVSRTADRYFVAISVDVENYHKKRKKNGSVGIDAGVKTAITLNDGTSFNSPKPLRKYEKILARRSRQHSNKKKGSNNKLKSQMSLARLHMKIANIRKDWSHKLTTKLCSENQAIIVEDVNISSWQRLWGKSVSDNNIGEIRRQLAYKSEIYKCQLVQLDKWEPTSKACSSCGSIKKDLTLKDRTYICESCGLEMDRDQNAAINIHTRGLREINAYGHERSGPSGRNYRGRSRNLKVVKSCV